MRFLARSFNVPGDHTGQSSTGYRWPYGPVAIVSPFNFPLGKWPGFTRLESLLATLVDHVIPRGMKPLAIGGWLWEVA